MKHRRGWARLEAVAALIADENVDTDQIFPARFLTRRLADYGVALFGSRRYLAGDAQDNPEFALNRPQTRNAQVLVCGANFGCGSSREHAVWALRDYGIRALLAPSFNEIFRGNCARNGIAALTLGRRDWEELAQRLANEVVSVEVDLAASEARVAGRALACELPALHRRMLIEGLDEIELTAEYAAAIDAYERRERAARPWVW